jgi:NAD(P)-dependent dehydrogenase (short-subunit alcohol dehydrogenase family)
VSSLRSRSEWNSIRASWRKLARASGFRSVVKDFDKLFAVNVRAPYFLLQQLLPILGGGSSVIFVASLGAHAAVGALSAYAATKGAIDTLVNILLQHSARAISASTPSRPA